MVYNAVRFFLLVCMLSFFPSVCATVEQGCTKCNKRVSELEKKSEELESAYKTLLTELRQSFNQNAALLKQLSEAYSRANSAEIEAMQMAVAGYKAGLDALKKCYAGK